MRVVTTQIKRPPGLHQSKQCFRRNPYAGSISCHNVSDALDSQGNIIPVCRTLPKNERLLNVIENANMKSNTQQSLRGCMILTTVAHAEICYILYIHIQRLIIQMAPF